MSFYLNFEVKFDPNNPVEDWEQGDNCTF
jgi:hypothetical protein